MPSLKRQLKNAFIISLNQKIDNDSKLYSLSFSCELMKNRQNGQAVVWVVVGLAALLGTYIIIKSQGSKLPKTTSPQESGQVTQPITPTVKETSAPDTTSPSQISPAKGGDNEQLDQELEKLDKESEEIDQSLNDKAIDVNQ